MMTLPKIGTAGVEANGVSVVARIAARRRADGGLGFIFREQPAYDVGIDGHIEVVDQHTTEATGKIVGVQVKAGQFWFRARCDGGWLVSIKKSTVRYWRQYAVPVILVAVNEKTEAAYWTLVSRGDFEQTRSCFKIFLPASQPFDSGAADAIVRLATQPSPLLVDHLRELTAQLSESTAAELERRRDEWREGRRTSPRAWAESWACSPARLGALSRSVAASVLRFAASLALDADEDVDVANERLTQARHLDPSASDVVLRAAILTRQGETAAAVDLLANASELPADQLRAALLLSLDRVADAEATLNACIPTRTHEVAEHWRLCSIARLATRDLEGAMAAAERAKQSAPRNLLTRWTWGALMYLSGLVADALPTRFQPWPQPLREEDRRCDRDALHAFAAAADAFREILSGELTQVERRRAEAWQLAAIAADPSEKVRALAVAREVLERDTTQPYVLFWAAVERLELDLLPNFDAVAKELEHTGDIETASIYASSRIAYGHNQGLIDWLDAWRGRFDRAGAASTWAVLRIRVLIRSGEIDQARSYLGQLETPIRQSLEVEIATADVERDKRDPMSLTRLLETAAKETGDQRFLLEASSIAARTGNWQYAAQHVNTLLERFPTPGVRRLAILARFCTQNDAECLSLIEQSLARAEPGTDQCELRRMRVELYSRAGRIPEAARELECLTEKGPDASTSDLLLLARLRFVLGQTHELAAGVRLLRSRSDLAPTAALMLAELLVQDDAALAGEFWEAAVARGIPDDAVPTALTLGYKLGFDARLRELTTRLANLASSGSPMVRHVDVGELVELGRDRQREGEKLLDIYGRGETLTQLVAQFLNEPSSHLYHVVPASNELQATLSNQFAVQVRDGSRGIPHPERELAGRGHLALDLSALLVAHHLSILPLVEARFAPLRLSHATIAALQEMRGMLRPHQPSQTDLLRRLLEAERRGWIELWKDDLPELTKTEKEAARGWAEWVALLERARREDAFVVDAPLDTTSPYDRPAEVAGPERLARLIGVPDFLHQLRSAGAVEPRPPEPEMESDHAHPLLEVPARAAIQLPRGAILYLTGAGADALAKAGHLASASEWFTLRVSPSEQAERRAHLEVLPEFEERAAWIEDLIRRISEGLTDGRYALLAPRRPPTRVAPIPTAPSNGIQTRSSVPDPPSAERQNTRRAAAKGPEATNTQVEQFPHSSNVGATDESGKEEETSERSLPLSLRLLEDLLVLPNGIVDAVWVDDRWLNRHGNVGTARIVDVLDVMASLEFSGDLSTSRRWDLQLRLRAGNFQIIPLTADELLHHLRAATVTRGAVVETRALRTIRHCVARLLADVKSLRIPTPSELSTGFVGDLEVLRSSATAVRETMVEVWREIGDPADKSAVELAEARSSWIVRNLYVDLGLLRARIVHPESPPEAGVSGLDAAGLFLRAIHLLGQGVLDQGATAGGDAVAAAYTAWIDKSVVARRVAHDPAFKRETANHLRRLLRNSPVPDSADQLTRSVSRALAGRLYGALPESWRALLSEDRELMDFLGRTLIRSLQIGDWHVSLDAFANAVATATDCGVATVPVLGDGCDATLTVAIADDTELTVSSAAEGESVSIRDSSFGVLSPDPVVRSTACDAMRSQVDLSVADWHAVTASLHTVTDPARRFEIVIEQQQRTLARRYAGISERWKNQQLLHPDDLYPPEIDLVLKHLRLSSEQPSPSDWEHAAEILVAEDGVEAALDRLAGVPVPIPAEVISAVSALEPMARRSVLGRALRRACSPVSAMNLLRLLAVLGQTEPCYHRWARRALAQVLASDWRTVVSLFREVALAAVALQDAARVGSASDARAGESAVAPIHRQGHDDLTGSLLAAWYHADKFVTTARTLGADVAKLTEWVAQQRTEYATTVFAPAVFSDSDVSNPSLIDSARFLIAGLQYASAETGWLDASASVKHLVRSVLTHFAQGEEAPPLQLLRTLSGFSNVLNSWLVPVRESDGSIIVGHVEVLSSKWSPVAVLTEAMQMVTSDPGSPGGWLALAVYNGNAPLTGPEARQFADATAELDVPTILRALGDAGPLAAERLAVQSLSPEAAQRREQLREAFLAAGRKDREDSRRTAHHSEHYLSEVQRAVFHGLYLLAQAESTPTAAMNVFAHDLSTLGRVDPTYLHRFRDTLEALVAERALSEAHALTSVLGEARGL